MNKKIDYEDMVQEALVGVVKDLLKSAAKDGLPGNHHFYITYNTTHPGVRMPDYLLEQYPESITIVIQYEFWDLKVEKSHFEITLSFNNMQEHLVVPFNAMTSFVDPSAKFGLQFTPKSPLAGEVAPFSGAKKSQDHESASVMSDEEVEGATNNVISFDAFRKKS